MENSDRLLEALLRLGHATASVWVVSSAVEARLRGTRWAGLVFWKRRKPVRVWIDGCYDVTHFGHYKAFRQARALGDILVVGLNSDAEVMMSIRPLRLRALLFYQTLELVLVQLAARVRK